MRTILSQNTTDTNRDVAFARLRERFPTWEAVRDAPLEEVEEAIRAGGLAPQKAPRIQEALREITSRAPPRRAAEDVARPDLDLCWLEDAPREEALEFLTSLPGVGRKTAACVLIFAFGRPEIPVDTHVYRVGGRLGLFPPKASFERAHDEMRAVTDPEDAYELHINLIEHGRRVCRPQPALRGMRAAADVSILAGGIARRRVESSLKPLGRPISDRGDVVRHARAVGTAGRKDSHWGRKRL